MNYVEDRTRGFWTPEGRVVTAIKASQKNLSSVTLSPDGKVLATAGLGDTITLWTLPAGELIHTLAGHETAVGSLRYLDNGRTFVSVGYEGAIKFWDPETWEERRSVRPGEEQVRGLAFAPGGTLAAVGVEGAIGIWSVPNWTVQERLPVSTKVINGVAFSGDGRWLAAGGADGKIRVWTLA